MKEEHAMAFQLSQHQQWWEIEEIIIRQHLENLPILAKETQKQ